MFPLPITTWLKIGAALAIAIFMWYSGYSFEASRFAKYRAQQAIETQAKEREYQSAANQIEKEKNVQIRNINAQLVDAVSELRKRPGRATETSTGKGCNGAGLYAEDSEFLVREAARADEIRVGLLACYRQYDAIK